MKLNDITPATFACHTDKCCPAVFETDAGTYVIIGKKLSAEAGQLVAGRVGADEVVIEVQKAMIDGLK
jgi:hypothetical protein